MRCATNKCLVFVCLVRKARVTLVSRAVECALVGKEAKTHAIH